MMAPAELLACPSADELLAHVAGGAPESRERLISHVERCRGCQTRVGELLRGAGDVVETDLASEWSASPQAFERGARFGEYVVLEHLGRGAAGSVYLALDPKLNRLVALKLISLPSAPHEREAARQRVLREGRALARLSHAHVVAVYDVGEREGHAYVAMEWVRGGTLRAWVEPGRPWRQTLGLLVQAGRGLAAAHRSGLVHRDFKPDNVLVGEDALARVTDFGLARSLSGSAAEPPPLPTAPPVPLSAADLEATLTRTGTLLGSPAYMAPEVLAGQSATPASDVFSFCVTAFECLYGERPFQGAGLAALRESVVAQRMVKVPGARRVPRRVLRLLSRGLAADPADRAPSLDALLDALELRRRRAPWLATVAAAGLAVAAAVALPGRREAALCEQSARWEGVWDEPRRAQVQRAFAAVPAPYAGQVFEHVRAVLDGYSREWSDAQRQRCLERSVRGSADSRYELLCLHQRREDVARLVQELTRADLDVAVVNRAAELSASLPPISRCALAPEAAGRPALADADRARVEQLQGALSEARLVWKAGNLPDAEQRARRVLEGAQELTLLPLMADARFLLGNVQRQLNQEGPDAKTLFDAALDAERAGLHAVAAESWLTLAATTGGRPGAEPERWLSLAEVAIRRAGEPVDLRAELYSHRGRLLVARGQFEGALLLQEEGVQLLEAQYGREDLRVASARLALAVSLGIVERCAKAEPLLRQVVATRERSLGATHPSTVEALEPLAICVQRLHRGAEAVALFEQIYPVKEALFGKGSPALATVLNNYAGALREAGRLEDALEMVRRAAALREQAYGPADPRVGKQVMNVGVTLSSLHREDEALQWLRRARDVLDAAGPDRAVDAALARLHMAQVLVTLRRPEEALRELEPVFKLAPAQLASFSGGPRIARGRALLALGRSRAAAADFSAVLAMAPVEELSPELRADAQRGLDEAMGRARPKE